MGKALPQMDRLITEYQYYVDKIINKRWRKYNKIVNGELYQIGMIGLWKGIRSYLEKADGDFNEDIFGATIYTFIRYEIMQFMRDNSPIKIGQHYWKNYTEVKKMEKRNASLPEEQFKEQVEKNGLDYEKYQKTIAMLEIYSLDCNVGDDEGSESNWYRYTPYFDENVTAFLNRQYAAYIIDSALAGFEKQRDKNIICFWLTNIYADYETTNKEIGKRFGICEETTRTVVNKFIYLCRFVRDCETVFEENPSGDIVFQVPVQQPTESNRPKVPGVSWDRKSSMWRVRIYVDGKEKCLGRFEEYESAIKARRDAELKYKGRPPIQVEGG